MAYPMPMITPMRDTTIRACIRWKITLLLMVCPALAQAVGTAGLDRAEVPASGSQKILLTIPQFGRYAISTSSEEGTALQLVDRMAGPGETSGRPGEENGRLDVFLDRGEYRILTHGDPRSSGKARVSVQPFIEKNGPQPPLLVELKQVESTLADLEQRSYWIEVRERRPVLVEAAGRSLGDLRLWKDGKWLLDAAPVTEVVQPRAGRPLFVCRLSVDLEAGLYLLTTYGRPPQAWAEETPEFPLYVRSGIPQLGLALRKRFTASPFGVDRFLVPARANYFRLELPAAAQASLKVGFFDPQSPFREDGTEAQISKKSVPPVAEVSMPSRETPRLLDFRTLDRGQNYLLQPRQDPRNVLTVGGNYVIRPGQETQNLVTVSVEPGQGYTLEYFERLEQYTFQAQGLYWLSTIHLGDPADSIDAAGILVENRPDGQRRLAAGRGIDLDLKTAWRRRINLLATEQLFLQVKEAGDYVVAGQGTTARYRIEPFLVSYPENYRAPAFQPSGFNWKLGAGWHVLTIQADLKGILDLTIRSNSWANYALNATGIGGEPPFRPARAAVRFPQLALQGNSSYTLIVNNRAAYGTVLRRLPLDLSDPLTLASEPGEEVEVPFRADGAGTLRAEAEDGSAPEVSLDGGVWQSAATVAPGPHIARVRHQKKQTLYFCLWLQPPALDPASALPPVSPEVLAKLPEFPALTEAKPQFLDLGRVSQATFLLNAESPGLYQVESTGLLATKAALRSRTIPTYAAESQNGTGRNFSLRQYLTQGDYQLTVSTEGESAGHLGVQLKRTRSISGGFLTSSVPARISLAAGQAVNYYFKITKPAQFRLRAFGLGRTFRCRLEDEQGWPLVAPGAQADITRFFDPGTYRLIILPEMTSARVVAQLEPILQPRAYKGHGPHRISLARTIQAVWMEPEAGQERLPDVWEFTLPAPSQVVLLLTGEMQGTLAAQVRGSSHAFVPPERGWQGRLAAGAYRLEVVSSRVNNRAPYRLAVSPVHLMIGMNREVGAPARIPISIGSEGPVELSSFGSLDVRARLYDAEGNLVAGNDDRPDDWNFQIIQTLGPGEYTLRVDPVGVQEAACAVSMRTPDQEEKGAVALPLKQEVALGRKTVVFPVAVPPDPGLLVVHASARDSLGLSLEADLGEGWRLLGTRYGLQTDLLVPVLSPAAQEVRYRLSVWSLDRRPTVAQLSVQAAAAAPATEGQLAEGVPLKPVPDSAFAFACARIERSGVFETDSDSAALFWSGDRLSVCAPPENGLIVARPGLMCVAVTARKGDSVRTAKARRLILQAGGSRYLQYRHGSTLSLDVADAGRGPLLVRAIGTTGQPGVSVRGVAESRFDSPKGGESSDRRSGSAWTVSDHSAICASLRGEDSVAELWSAAPTDDLLVVKAEPFAFAEPAVEPVPVNGDGEVEAQAGKRFALNAGWKRVSLSLGSGLVALLTKSGAIETVHWKPGQSLFETVDTDAEQIYLLNTEKHPNRFALDALPLVADQAFPMLAKGRPYETDHVRAGIERLKVTDGLQRATLRVRGGDQDAVFVSRSGRVARGEDFTVDAEGGELHIPHGTGPLICWIDEDGSDDVLWPAASRPSAVKIEPPTVVTLAGRVSHAFRFVRSSPGLVHFRASGPLLITVKRPSVSPGTTLHNRGADAAVYLPEGSSELLVRGLAGHPLAGQAEFEVTAVTKLEEGPGAEVLLPPGGSRLYSFEVEREGEIGVAVRAESEVVELELMNVEGKVIEKGSLMMPRVKPGIYLLNMQASSTAVGPVKARPVVVGLKLPDTGPPAEVIQDYLRPADEARSFSSTVRESHAPRFSGESEEQQTLEETETEEPVEEPTEEPTEPGSHRGR